MSLFPSSGYLSDSARTKGEQKTALENILSGIKEMPGGTAETSVTLSGDSFTAVNNYAVYKLETESSAASDTLSRILTTNVRDGQIVWIRLTNSSHVITIDHGIGGAGQILTHDGFDIDLTDTKQVVALKYNAANTSWEVVGFTPNIYLMPPSGAAAALVYASHPTSASTRPILRSLAKEHLNTIMDTTVGWKSVSTITVSTNTITPTQALHKVDTSGGSQTINTISTANMGNGRVIFLSPSDSNSLTLAHQVGSAGTGRITLRGAANLTLSTTDQGVWLVQESGDWREIDRCGIPSSGAVQGVCQGRLTLTSGSAFTLSDVTGAGTLYFTPYGGNQVATYSGTAWSLSTFSEKSLSLASLLQWTNYDVYLVDGTLALEAVAWASAASTSSPAAGSNVTFNIASTPVAVGDWVTIRTGSTVEMCRVNAFSTNTSITVDSTANAHTTPTITFNQRATALAQQNGVYVKSGATTRLYLGTIRMQADGQCEVSNARLFVWNYYNRKLRKHRAQSANTSWTLSNTTFRCGENLSDDTASGKHRINYVIGVAEDMIDTRYDASYLPGGVIQVGIGYDSITTNSAQMLSRMQPSGAIISLSNARLIKNAAVGFHFVQDLECISGSTGTIYGTGNTTPSTTNPFGASSALVMEIAA